jgi:hypothetical protein
MFDLCVQWLADVRPFVVYCHSQLTWMMLEPVALAHVRAVRYSMGVTQESGVHAMAPIDALRSTPLPQAVAVVDLADAAAAARDLPEGTTRFAVSCSGTESEEQLLGLRVGSLLS